MTTEELAKIDVSEWNALIAQRCGWTRFGMFGRYGKCAIISIEGDTLHGTPPCDKDKPEDEQQYLQVPDFANSLDAMGLAEATLTAHQLEWFEEHLRRIVHRDTTDADWQEGVGPTANTKIWHATAEQRARAFLLTI